LSEIDDLQLQHQPEYFQQPPRGDLDVIMGRTWIKNPGNLAINPDLDWPVHLYDGGMPGENHDIVAMDLDLDGREEIISYAQNEGIIRWYKIDDPLHWEYQDIAREVNVINVHAGLAPRGVGDINGDGFPDVLMPFYWYENPGEFGDTNWVRHEWNYQEIKETPYGRSFRSSIIDLDEDGDNDLVVAECDVTMSMAYWYENTESGLNFMEHILPLPKGNTGSFHSLVVADFDLDGDSDIFLGEQGDNNQKPDPGMKPLGLKERGILLINRGNGHQLSLIFRLFMRIIRVGTIPR
jgi:hypothetical protein